MNEDRIETAQEVSDAYGRVLAHCPEWGSDDQLNDDAAIVERALGRLKDSEKLMQALLDFWSSWHVGFDQVTPRDHVRAVMERQGIDGDATIASYRQRIQPRIDAFNERVRASHAEYEATRTKEATE